MTLFLRWAIVNVVAAAGLAGAVLAYGGEIHSAGLAAAAVVGAVYVCCSGYLGYCAFTGRRPDGRYVALAVRACPMVALLGTVSGFLIALTGSASDVQTRIVGASTGLAATFVGIAATLVLMVLARLSDVEE